MVKLSLKMKLCFSHRLSQYILWLDLASITLVLEIRTLISVLLPIKRVAKSIGKEVLKSRTNFVSDILEGKNLKQAALNRTKETGSNLWQKVTTFPRERKRI